MARDLSDVSDDDVEMDDFENLPEFQREKLLAERHAQELRRKHHEQLAPRQPSTATPAPSANVLGFDTNLEYLEEDALDVPAQPLEPPSVDGQTPGDKLFDEDKRLEHKLLNVPLVNSARVSKSGVLHILEHPHASDYLEGALLKVLISGSTENSSKDGIAMVFPGLFGTHQMFRIERLIQVPVYNVYGTKFQTCDHDDKSNVLGTANYIFRGTLLSQDSSLDCTVSLNDICNLPFVGIDIANVNEYVAQDIQHAAHVLKGFTFTDEDVALILEQRAEKQSVSKNSLIFDIQQLNHEIDLLKSQTPQDTGRIKALEKRKLAKENHLKSLKGTTKQEICAKSYKVLRGTNDSTATLRKTTQPTPMIMCPGTSGDSDDDDNDSGEIPGVGHATADFRIQGQSYTNLGGDLKNRNFRKRTLTDLSIEQQYRLVEQYKKLVEECPLEAILERKASPPKLEPGYISVTEYFAKYYK